MNDIYDNLIFTGMDFVNEPKNILREIEDMICDGMRPDQKLAYRCGVETVLNLICGIVNDDPNDIFVHINGLEHQEEFVLEDLINRIGE